MEKLIGDQTVATLYAKLPTSRMKAIVAMHFELGYPQELVAEAFGVSQSALNQEIGVIRNIFLDRPVGPKYGSRYGLPYKPRPHVSRSRRPIQPISLHDLMEIMVMLTQP